MCYFTRNLELVSNILWLIAVFFYYKISWRRKVETFFFIDYFICCNFDRNIWSSCFVSCACFNERIVLFISLKKKIVCIYKHPRKFVHTKKLSLGHPQKYVHSKSKKILHVKTYSHENLPPYCSLFQFMQHDNFLNLNRVIFTHWTSTVSS